MSDSLKAAMLLRQMMDGSLEFAARRLREEGCEREAAFVLSMVGGGNGTMPPEPRCLASTGPHCCHGESAKAHPGAGFPRVKP